MAVFDIAPDRKEYPQTRTITDRISRGGMSLDKLVKGATKAKDKSPKSKYIDPLVQATFSDSFVVSDIAQAIAPRLRDSNSTVVFKALIVVHTLLRSGQLKNVYSTWSSKPHLLGLNSVTSGHDTAQNLNKYAYYLHARLKTYDALRRDAIRDRAERTAEGRGAGAEKLRGLTVEKGLLREVEALQRLLDALLDCKFYLEDRDDDVTMTALRLLVKDLLILFMSVNEGVINVLEHYFEMSHSDATTALKIYKHFCRQTQKVVQYLGVAKKMQNILNVQIPNLKHAPVSLAGSLEEYLKDPNFENNRLEYKENREIAEGKRPASKPRENGSTSTKAEATSSRAETSSAGTGKPDGSKAFIDFFEAIEQEQTSMFDPQTGSPSQAYFQQQAAFNPFLGQPAPFLQPQLTGAIAFGGLHPQMTGMSPFGMNAFGHPQMLAPQPTGFLQPQATGANPFRQSMLMPQMTGNPFGQQQRPMSAAPFPQPSLSIPQSLSQSQSHSHLSTPVSALQPQWTGMNAFQRPASAPMSANASNSQSNGGGLLGVIPEQQPLNAGNTMGGQPQSAQQTPHPLAPQPTGSKNPFAPSPSSPPPAPKAAPPPSINQLAFQAFQNHQVQQQQGAWQQSQQQASNQPFQQAQPQQQSQPSVSQSQQQNSFNYSFSDMFNNSMNLNSSTSGQQQKSVTAQPTGIMGSIASDFAFGRTTSPPTSMQHQSNGSNNGVPGGIPPSSTGSLPSFTTGTTASSASNPSFSFSSPGSQNTGSSAFQPSNYQAQAQPLQSQPTGFGGSTVKPFQPSSTFGANLFAEHAQSGGSGPQPPQQQTNALGASTFGTSQQSQQHTPSGGNVLGASTNGNAFGTSLQPQATGTPNPFRMSMMPSANGQPNQASGANAFSSNVSANFFGSSAGIGQPQQTQQQPTQGNSWGSLI